MKKLFSSHVLLFLSLITACSNNAVSKNENRTVNATPVQEIKKDEKRTQELRNQIEQIASASKGRVGVSAMIVETGESVSINPNEHFPMQSVYKLPIGMAVMQQVDSGKLKLDQKVRVKKSDFVSPGQRSPIRDKYPNGTELTVTELMQMMISESDGTASDVLLELVGGPNAVMNYLKELGINEMVVANSEKEFAQDWQTQYRSWSSPDGTVQLLKALHEKRGLSEQSQTLIIKFMTESPTGPRRLKGLLPKDTVVAHKTGTSGTRNGINAATNDIGIVSLPNGQHLAIAVFVSESPLEEAAREEVIAKIAKAMWDKWSN